MVLDKQVFLVQAEDFSLLVVEVDYLGLEVILQPLLLNLEVVDMEEKVQAEVVV